jgi:hypothetical protein
MEKSKLQAIGGLIAVAIGVTAVTALAIITITRFGSDDKDSIVAVTSSAFGIISAVVGAYLGIKITADTSDKATAEARNAAVAQHEANVAQQKLSAVQSKAEDMLPESQASAIKEAGAEAEEAARATTPPPPGGRT